MDPFFFGARPSAPVGLPPGEARLRRRIARALERSGSSDPAVTPMRGMAPLWLGLTAFGPLHEPGGPDAVALFLVVVDYAAFHAAGDRDHLARDVA
jgi:hypothetical protein